MVKTSVLQRNRVIVSAIQIGKCLLAGLLVVGVAGCADAQVSKPTLDKLDRGMGSVLLGSVIPAPDGRLVEDGEGACDRLPSSACGYEIGPYTYYFSDGKLVSKTFEFVSANDTGPWGLRSSDTPSEVVRKLATYLGRIAPVVTDGVLYYEIECSPNLCRLDVQMRGGGIESIRLYYSDTI